MLLKLVLNLWPGRRKSGAEKSSVGAASDGLAVAVVNSIPSRCNTTNCEDTSTADLSSWYGIVIVLVEYAEHVTNCNIVSYFPSI